MIGKSFGYSENCDSEKNMNNFSKESAVPIQNFLIDNPKKKIKLIGTKKDELDNRDEPKLM